MGVRAYPTAAVAMMIAACGEPQRPPALASTPLAPPASTDPAPPTAAPPMAPKPPKELDPTIASACAPPLESGILEGIELCGAPHEGCFGRVTKRNSDIAMLRIAQGTSADAEVVVTGEGMRVHAIIDAGRIELHTAKPILVARWFVPAEAPAHLREVANASATLEYPLPSDVDGAAPLRSTIGCAELVAETREVTIEEAAHVAGVTKASTSIGLYGPTPLRATLGGEPVATLRTGGRADVIGKSGKFSRVVVPVDGGFAVGWVETPTAMYGYGGHGGRGIGHIRNPGFGGQVSCPHDVPVLVRTGEHIVHAGTIETNTHFDPDDLARVFLRAGVELFHTAHAEIAAHALDGCEGVK
jgi:hypothetical protein